MKSHRYEFAAVDLLRIVGWPLVPVACLALAVHTGVRLAWCPRPRPTLDVERTILIHQADATRSTNQAEVLLLGDSSCLMDVSARRLSEQLARRTLDLGTFSFLDLNAHALLLDEYRRHHPVGPQAVVLLMHPEALRRIDSEPYYLSALTSYYAGTDQPVDTSSGQLAGLVGASQLQGRLLARLLPTPLPGAYGRHYGFSRDLDAFMTREHGSVFDPEPQSFSGAPEYRLSPTIEKASRAFRKTVPAQAKLFVGITPVPARFAGPKYPARRAELLRDWGAWLQADGLLEELPATLPDEAFVRTTHLREPEALAYTDRLATALRQRLPQP